MGLEYELKFTASRECQDRMRQEIGGEETVLSMETTYYDTPQGAMAARYYTLRRRMENEISVCTLKTPAQGQGRQEYECQCADIRSAIPELCKLSGLQELPSLLAAGVVPVCGARFTRIAKTVKLPEAIAELALDSGVLLGGGKEWPLCEIEVELKEGKPEAVAAFAAQLALGVGLKAEKYSKFRRALALYRGE